VVDPLLSPSDLPRTKHLLLTPPFSSVERDREYSRRRGDAVPARTRHGLLDFALTESTISRTGLYRTSPTTQASYFEIIVKATVGLVLKVTGPGKEIGEYLYFCLLPARCFP